MPSLLITPSCPKNIELKDFRPRVEHIEVVDKLLLFDKVVTLKRSRRPALIRFARWEDSMGERMTLFENEADQHFLVAKGLIESLDVPGNQKLLEAAFQLRGEFAKENERNGLKPTDVVFEQKLADFDEERNLALNIDFENLICLPERGVALEEVIDFKERRQSEYEAFWGRLYELASDPAVLCRPDAQAVVERTIRRACEELEAVSQERWASRVRKSFQLKFTFDTATITRLTAAIAALETNLPPLSIALAGSAVIRPSLDLFPGRTAPTAEAAAFSYLSSIKRF